MTLEKQLAVYNQQVIVIRLEKMLLNEMSNNEIGLLECPSYAEYRKQMDILDSLIK